MKAKDLRKKLIETSEAFREAYFKRNLPLEISHMVTRERIRKGYTQEQLSKLVGTQQSGIARTERGTTYPDIDFLERIASALGVYLSIEFKETQDHTNTWEQTDEKMRKIELPSPYFSKSNLFKNDISDDVSYTKNLEREN